MAVKKIYACIGAKKYILISYALLLLFNYSSGQNEPNLQLTKDLDQMFSEQFNSTTPGCAVLVAKKGQIIYNKAFGLANMELSVPMQVDMVFRIGSITKQFTAVAILQLVEKGKIALSDSLQKFIKNFPSMEYPVRIENLLTHTSGLVDYMSLGSHQPFAWRMDFKQEQVIDLIKNVPLEFKPGSKFKYSNSNYFLLGHIIEQISGISYQQYLEQNIFISIGLTNTYYGSDTLIIPNRISGYKKIATRYLNAEYLSMTLPFAGGALLSNVEDLFKWNKALHSYRIVKKETLDKAQSAYRLSDGSFSEYGYGWFIMGTKGSETVEHGGRIDGFRANAIYLPSDDVFVVTFFNSENDEFLNLASVVANLVIAKPSLVNKNILTDYIGNYQLASDSKRLMTVSIINNMLVLHFTKNASAELEPQSDTKFTAKNVRPVATVEFLKENGLVTKMIVSQNGDFEWKKIK